MDALNFSTRLTVLGDPNKHFNRLIRKRARIAFKAFNDVDPFIVIVYDNSSYRQQLQVNAQGYISPIPLL